ncbi:hypothetical protein BRC19_02920 [Candidatus Saccharibacteria bacterium QS_5_54_17]|nr:MAG: hypothetical protein BRC19_02920 [Candidatus Saccharibacteria bacterium QS_5_54_17]
MSQVKTHFPARITAKLTKEHVLFLRSTLLARNALHTYAQHTFVKIKFFLIYSGVTYMAKTGKTEFVA